MKKFIYILLVIIVALLIVMSLVTRKVDRTSYYDNDYYKKSILHLDSLRKNHRSVCHVLEAGFSKVSITPGLHYPEDNVEEGKFKNVTLSGHYARKGKFATGIHDSIFIRVASIKVADKLMIIVGSDMLLIPKNITDMVLSLLHQDGIRRDQLMFTATHDHTTLGGWGTGYFGAKLAGELNENMVRWLSSRISLAVRASLQDFKPAKIGSGNVAAASYIKNRLIGETGTKNDDFSYIILEQISGKKAIIGSFSAHASILDEKCMEIGVEYPGYWQRKMENSFADYAIFCAGAMGSQNPAGFDDDEDLERIRKIGEGLADIVLQSASATIMKDTCVFSAITMKLNLPKFGTRIMKNRTLVPIVCNEIISVPEHPVLQALRLNDMVWISTPADFSGEIALQIKNYLCPKGFNANITSFNGHYLGYIIPSKYYFLESYESRGMGWFGPNMGDYTTDLILQMSDIVIH